MTLDEYVRDFEAHAQRPEGALRQWFRALLHLERDARDAEQWLAMAFNGKQLHRDARAPSGWDVGHSVRFLLQQLQAKPAIVRSYLGGTPARRYADFDPVTLPLTVHPHGTRIAGMHCVHTLSAPDARAGQLSVQSAGKDLPTVVYMERNARGLWKIDVRTLSSVATGVRGLPSGDF